MAEHLSKKLYDAADQMHALQKQPYATIEPAQLLVFARLYQFAAVRIAAIERIEEAEARKNKHADE